MKTLKRRIAVILTFSMIFELLPVMSFPVYADPYELIEEDSLIDDEQLLSDEVLLSEETFDQDASDRELLSTPAAEDAAEKDLAPDGADDIASGTYNNVTWSIDSYGCLYVSGTNDFKAKEEDAAPWHVYSGSIKTAEINLTNYTRWLSGMFEDCSKLEKVTFKKLVTTDVTSIRNMFRGCSSLKVIDATKISPKTQNQIKDMSGLFDGCSSLTDIYMVEYKAGTNNVLAMFDTTYVEDMSNMFRGCSALSEIDFSKIDTASVTNMDGMFSGCTSLTHLDLTKFNMSYVVSANKMLNCPNLVSVNSPRFPTNTGRKNIEIDLPGTGWMRTDSKTPVTALTDAIPAGTLVTTNNPSEEDKIYKSGSIKDKVFWTLYKDGTLVVTGNGEIRDPSNALPPWLDYKDRIKKAEIDLMRTYDLSDMFLDCASLSMANLSRLSTSDATDMSFMFSGCETLESVDLSDFNTARVTKMSGMFKDCKMLKSLDLFHLDTSKVTDMSGMFSGCSSLADIDFTGSDLSKLKGKPRLFKTTEVRNMSEIFKNCTSMNSLDLTKFDLNKTNNVTDMFNGCDSLEKLYSPANRQMVITLPRCDVSPLGVWKNNTTEKRVNKLPVDTQPGILFTYEREEGEYGDVRWWIDSSHVLHVEGRGNFRDPDGPVPWAVYTDDILQADINLTESTDLSRMLESCDRLTQVTFRNNTMTAKCTNMLGMFRGCKSLATVDLSDFDTSLVTDMSYMFEGCELMESIPISGFNTGRVIDVRGMFRNCVSLKELDLSTFDLSSVTEAYRVDKMLENCTALEKVSAPDKLFCKLSLPVIEGKGWRLSDDERIPPERFSAIPARTTKGTEFITAEDIAKITLYEEDGVTKVKPSYDLEPGNTLKIVAKIEPVTANPLEIVWDTADKEIATVSPDKNSVNASAGTVEVVVKAGDKTGNALITASFGETEPQMFSIRVSSMLKLDPAALDIVSGKTMENAIRATVNDPSYSVSDLVWTSEYPKVLKVTRTADGASIEAKSGITANRKITVTARTADGKYSDVCIVTIVPDPDPDLGWGDIEEEYIREAFSNDLTKVPEGLWYLMPYNEGLSENEVGYNVYLDSAVLSYNRIYNGSDITFDEKFRVYYGVRRLWRGRDYTIAYKNNRFAADSNDDKPPYFTISGTGSFQNSAEFRFNILPEDINNAILYSDAVVCVDGGTKLATIQPNLRYNKTRLVTGKNYVLEYYKNSVSADNLIAKPKTYEAKLGEKYYVVITGREEGDFTGTWKDPIELVTIDPSDKSIVRMNRVKVRTKQLDWSKDPYKLTDLFNNTVSDNDVFEVVYERYTLVYGSDFTVDDLELSDAGEYTIKLHGTAGSSGGQLSFIGDKSVKIEIKGIPASKVKFAAFTGTVYYTGDVITMEDLYKEDGSNFEKVTLYTVRDGRQELLVEGLDYDYEMVNSGATGRFDLVVRLKREYYGVITKPIRVLRYNIYDDTKNLIDIDVENTTFSRAGAKPKVRVYFAGKQLVENIDYMLTYKNNSKLGEETDGPRAPQVIVTGIGNFSAKTSVKFTISKAKLENIKLVLDDKEYKAKFSKNYYKSTPRLMDDGALVKMGKGKDLESIDRKSYTYRYADSGALIPADTVSGIPDGTLIEVSVLITAGEKSPYEAGTIPVTGYYRFVSKYKSMKSAKISLLSPTEIICSDSEEEIMDLLEKNLYITIKNAQNEVVTLRKDKDYTITSLTNYMYPGTATITIEGMNAYSGTVTYKFKMYRRKK